jgi:hypothetical protein
MQTVPIPGVLVLDGDEVITGRGTVLGAPDYGTPAEILDRLSGRLGDNGLVLMTGRDPGWSRITDPGGNGWKVTGGPAWWTARRQDHRLRIGMLPEIPRENDPLIGEDPVTTAVRHQVWASLAGVPFYGDGGTVSALILDATVSVRGRPVLRRWDDQLAPRVMESPWCGPWEVPVSILREYNRGVTVDRNAQFLAAAREAMLPCDALARTGAGAFDGAAGLWQIRVPRNPQPRLPHPCGARATPGTLQWFATPTLELLDFLGAGIIVTDSWTAPRDRSRRLLDGSGHWYERLRDARNAVIGNQDPDSLAMLQAVKDTYSRGVDHLAVSPERRWYRPDWTAILRARARCQVWRAMWQAGTIDGTWPTSTRTDSVTYETPAPPPSLRIGTGMGEWKIRPQEENR